MSTKYGKKKVTVSRYRPKSALVDPEVKAPDFLDLQHYEGGKVVTLTHRSPLPPGGSWYQFLEAESTPGHMVQSVATQKNPQRHHWGSIPRPSD